MIAKVEPDERYRLSHNDAISVVKPGLVVFVFFHEGKMSKLYPDIFDKFLVGEEVGSGSFSVVYEGYKRFSMEKVAMKIIKKKRKSITTESGSDVILRTEDVFKEVDILKNLEHPCVNQLVDFIHSPTNTVIVLEFAAGGELFEQVRIRFQQALLYDIDRYAKTMTLTECRRKLRKFSFIRYRTPSLTCTLVTFVTET